MIISFLKQVMYMLFPSTCYRCGKETNVVCEKCLKLCLKAVETPSLFITSIYSFKDPFIKRAIHAIKYYHRRDLIPPLTDELADAVKKICAENKDGNWVLVPIPMPRMRVSMRGYNQAELIAAALYKKSGVRYDTTILTRTRTPKRQVQTSTRHERLHNQVLSFCVQKEIRGLHIILVDDVTTTGTTLSEARKTLLQKGASSVCAVTIAH